MDEQQPSEDVAANQLARLTPDLLRRVASFLPRNDAIANFKLVNQETAAALRGTYNKYCLARKPAHSRCGTHPLAEHPWPARDFVSHWDSPAPWRALDPRDRATVVVLAASSLHPPSLEVALRRCGVPLSLSAMHAAAAVGDVAACERLLAEGCEPHASSVAGRAAENGHLHVLQWMDGRGLMPKPATGKQDPKEEEREEEEGDGEEEEEERPRGFEAHHSVAVCACRGGHRHILAWAEERVGPELVRDHEEWKVRFMAAAAASNGHVDLLDELAARITPTCFDERRECLQILNAIAHGCPLAVLQRYFEAGRTEGSRVGVWVGKAVLRGNRARDLLSAALSSPLPDWREKLDWLLARCEGYPDALQAEAAAGAATPASLHTPHAAAQARIAATPEAFRISAAHFTAAPEDEEGTGEGGDWDGEAAEGSHGGTGRKCSNRSHTDGSRRSGRSSSGNGFRARLVAVHERGLVVVFRDFSPDCWLGWAANAAALLTDMLYGGRCPQLQLTPALLERACKQRCLRVLRAVLQHAGPGVFGPEHAMLAAGGEGRPPGPLPVDDSRALEVMGFFDRLGLLPPQASSATPLTDGAGSSHSDQPAQQQRQQQWSRAMTDAVKCGNGLRFVRYLHERCGAAPDPVALAVTGGCSVEVLEWAVGVLRWRISGREEEVEQLPAFTEEHTWEMISRNPPALAWALRHLSAPWPGLDYVADVALPEAYGAYYYFPQLARWLRLCARAVGAAEGSAAGEGPEVEAEGERDSVARWLFDDAGGGLGRGLGATNSGGGVDEGAAEVEAGATPGAGGAPAGCFPTAHVVAAAAWIRSGEQWARLSAALEDANWNQLPKDRWAWMTRLRGRLTGPSDQQQDRAPV